MKNLSLTFFFLFISTKSFAQHMPVYDADTTVFEMIVLVLDGSPSAEIYVSGDTIVNNQSYKKVWVDSEYDDSSIELVGFTRENTNEGKIWFRRIADTTENLVMDLSLEVGDTFLLNEPNVFFCNNAQELIVTSIDTVEGRKIISFDCFVSRSIQDSLTFIEGVGSNTTIFFQIFDLTEFGNLFYANGGYTLCRMLKNGTAFYPEDGTELCRIYSSVTDINKSVNINISPNPTTSIINIEPFGQINSVYLYNTSGVFLLSQKNNFSQLDISKLPKGIYFLKIELDTGEIIVKKIVKGR